MMRITLESPALIAVRNWLAGSQPTPRSGRSGSRKASRTQFRTEQLEPRTMLDAGMPAALPDLADESDTGTSSTDERTHDRTPTLSGNVMGAASQVAVRIDGVRVDKVPVINGNWKYTLPAGKALDAGTHKIAVRPLDAQGKAGKLSKSLDVKIVTQSPAPSTIGLAGSSDTGPKGDGQTIVSRPTIRGIAPPGRLVSVYIDGEPVVQVKSDAKTGQWSVKAPRLASGTHDVMAVVENRAGLKSAAASVAVTVHGKRTVMLDASGAPVELTASHILGRQFQGFTVTNVHGGRLEKWSPAKSTWQKIPAKAMTSTAPDSLEKAPAIRKILFRDRIRWTPTSGSAGQVAAFDVIPRDKAGGATQPVPAAGTVPGKVGKAQIAPLPGGGGSTITWGTPTDGYDSPSTLYSIQVTQRNGKTSVYIVPRTVHSVPIVGGGAILNGRVWGASNIGAGEARTYDAIARAELPSQLKSTVTSGVSSVPLEVAARSQLANSLTPTRSTTSLPLGSSHADLVYLEVKALPDATEAALDLPAGTPLFISSESNELTPKQRAHLKANPIYARGLFPGTVGGDVEPDQSRVHFQAQERLQFAGNVHPSVRNRATIVVETAQILQGGERGPWLEEARIKVRDDGSFSHNYAVPYGQISARVRLEYQTQPAPTAVRAASGPTVGSSTSALISTPIDLSSSFNAFGITTAPWQAPNNQGFDKNGNYYNSDYTGSGTKDPTPGTPITYSGITFPIGPIPTEDGQVGGGGNSAKKNPPNFVQAKGQTIDVSVDADKSDYLYLAGAASNGDQLSQKITLKFTDGTTETWAQSFHDWASVGTPQQDAQSQITNPKLPVKVASVSPIESLSGLQTIDGVSLVAGDRVLVNQQLASADNGIYVVAAGAWSRAKDADTGAELVGASTAVNSGTYGGGTLANLGDSTIILGTTPILFYPVATPPVPAPRPFAGELLLKTEPERINQQGNLVTTPAHIFAYCRNLHGKQLASITLPNNDNIGILSAVVAKAPVIAVDQGFVSLVLGTTNLTGIDLMALTIKNETNIGAGGGPLPFYFADQPEKGTTTSVSVSSIATTGGFVNDGNPFSGGGFDGDGNAYSWQALGSSPTLRWNGVSFNLGRPEQLNYVAASGQTIPVPTKGSFTTVNLAAAAVNGGQQNQQLTLTFTDGSTAVWTQSFSDWCSPQNYVNEAIISTQAYRDTASGGTDQTKNYVYGYSYTIPSGKTLASITLPANSDVRVLDIQMSPPTYTTKKVTVPMGQQQTIAYIAPDSSSQMTFYVEMEGVDASKTFLTNWNNGSGKSNDFANNISPSLDSQMKPGQHWTMTIQNAGLGYYGYLDSPSGQGLPSASGSTPAGAQFTLETANEIKYQPPWAQTAEEIYGEILVIVGVTILTAGSGDALIFGVEADEDELVVQTKRESKWAPPLGVIPEVDEELEEDTYAVRELDGIRGSIFEDSLASLEEDGNIYDQGDAAREEWEATKARWRAGDAEDRKNQQLLEKAAQYF